MTNETPTAIDPGDLKFWQGRWQSGQTGWDQGSAHPLLATLVARALDAGALAERGAEATRILEPGAGRAHNGAALAAMGYQVTSFDGVAAAIDGAKALYADRPNLTLAVADALLEKPEWHGAFDAVFDRAMLCALPPESRRAYAAAAFAHLKAGGYFLSILFSKVVHDDGRLGPPFQVTMTELSHVMAPYFAVVTAAEFPVTVDNDRIKEETIVVMKRRARALVESQGAGL